MLSGAVLPSLGYRLLLLLVSTCPLVLLQMDLAFWTLLMAIFYSQYFLLKLA